MATVAVEAGSTALGEAGGIQGMEGNMEAGGEAGSDRVAALTAWAVGAEAGSPLPM